VLLYGWVQLTVVENGWSAGEGDADAVGRADGIGLAAGDKDGFKDGELDAAGALVQPASTVAATSANAPDSLMQF
jgi:hypothetical protein